MNITYGDNIMRVIILDISGVYAQIFDEVYCKRSEYKDLVDKYRMFKKYKVVLI